MKEFEEAIKKHLEGLAERDELFRALRPPREELAVELSGGEQKTLSG